MRPTDLRGGLREAWSLEPAPHRKRAHTEMCKERAEFRVTFGALVHVRVIPFGWNMILERLPRSSSRSQALRPLPVHRFTVGPRDECAVAVDYDIPARVEVEVEL